MKVHCIGHSSFRIETKDHVHLYIDPWQVPDEPPRADVILVTHDHYDHCSPDDIRKVTTARTRVAGPTSVVKKLGDEGIPVERIDAGDVRQVGPFKVRAVEAYNVDKFRPSGEPFHPWEAGFVGFVIEIDGTRIYFAGDTDIIPPDVENDGPIDLAFLPVSGKFVMTPEEAARQITGRGIKEAIPMHIGAIVGSQEEANAFAEVASCVVTVLERGQVSDWPPLE